MQFLPSLLVLGLTCTDWAASSKIETKIEQDFQKSSLINVLLTFRGANPNGAIAFVEGLRLESREARQYTLYSVLKEHAEEVQEEVTSFLRNLRDRKPHMDLRQIWTHTVLIIRNIDRDIVEQLASLDSVESIRAEKFYQLEGTYTRKSGNGSAWGIPKIRVPEVWATGNRGEGIILANIDTGVRHTHVSLHHNYRGTIEGTHDYNWYDPAGHTDTPYDDQGHGTHTMGTIAGDYYKIGVAPGATWIACKGCIGKSCSRFDLLECGQWITCPTTTSGSNPNCAKAPQVVCNSWGSHEKGNTWYDEIINGWRAVGIVAVFSAGNSGPRCRTHGNPGDRPGVISVSSIDNSGRIAETSSRGPSADARMKPDICAPGDKILSASYESDDTFETRSGTSMACPHVVGVIGLLLNEEPNLSVSQVEERLKSYAMPIRSSDCACNGVKDTVYPNYQAGAGLVDAVRSVLDETKAIR